MHSKDDIIAKAIEVRAAQKKFYKFKTKTSEDVTAKYKLLEHSKELEKQLDAMLIEHQAGAHQSSIFE